MAEPRDLFEYEKRVQLDGGLNTRGSPLQVGSSQVVEVSNFRTSRRGSIEVRDGASLLTTVQFPCPLAAGLTANSRISAPVLELVGGGTFPQPATYTCKIALLTWGSGQIGASLVSAGVTTDPANQSIKVKIPANNLGEASGTNSPGIDDPFMLGVASAIPLVYIESTANPGVFYWQGIATFVWNTTDRAYEYTYAAFQTGAGTIGADSVAPQAIQKVYQHLAADMAVILSAGRCFQFPTFQAISGANEWHTPADKSGNLYYMGRSAGAPIEIAEVTRVMVATDGFRPKKSSIGDGSSTPYLTPNALNRWVMLGANPPSAVPTVADTGAGATFVAGNMYTYRQTNIYRHSRVIDRNRTEYWYSESAPVQSATHTVVAANTNLTVTFASLTGETNLYRKRLYRSVNHSATPTAPGRFYRLADVTPATATYVDSTVDGTIAVAGRKTDPDDEGKLPLDCPPVSLIHPIEHQGRIWGIVGRYVNVSSVDYRVRAIVGTEIARLSQKQLSTYVDPAGNDSELIEQSIDAWPDHVDYTLQLGGGGSVSAWLSHRGRILVFKTNELGTITGSQPGGYDYEVLFTDIGAIPNSVINVQGTIFFWNADKGPYLFDGQSYKWIGDDIQLTWKTDKEAGYYCSNVIHDRVTNEVRWSFTNADVDPANTLSEANDRGTWKEWVLHLPSMSWWSFSGTARSRDVRASGNLLSQNLTNPVVGYEKVTFGDTLGRILQDHGGAVDPISPADQVITATVVFRLFGYLEDFNWVKVFKWLTMIYNMRPPASGTVVVSAKTSEGANYGTVMTLSAGTTGEKASLGDVPSPVSAVDNSTQDRGLWVKITSTVTPTVDATNPSILVIHALMLEYQRVTHQRRVT